ncbi:hypothetical protein AN958_09382 [Leucoagaricus sp. SymC.cos]|nr:hypothetical protein AN958_09382 [Leucoagaricus sp. SymC.cos]
MRTATQGSKEGSTLHKYSSSCTHLPSQSLAHALEMRLILSSPHPRNSTYTTEDGRILYKVHKPYQLSSSIATIRKAVRAVNGVWQGDLYAHPPMEQRAHVKSTFLPQRSSADNSRSGSEIKCDVEHVFQVDEKLVGSDAENDTRVSSPLVEGHFAFYAQVEFRVFSASRFRYNSLDVSVDDFFHKEGWSWFGRGRVFTASDGKEYRWDLRAGYLEMIRNDESKSRVVKFREYQMNLGPLGKGRQASLEVDPSCEPILDEIMMTFIYCHKLRKDREESQHY